MSYIYHIWSTQEPKTIYIGQASANETHGVKTGDSVSGNRVLQHFSGLYDNNHENDQFNAWMKRHPLNTIQIEIYDEGNNYGIKEEVFDRFFSTWSPKGQEQAVEIQVDKSDNETTKPKKIKKDNKRDAAEILHIYHYAKHGFKLLNVQMGGSSYFVSAGANGAKRILNREMSVKDMIAMVDADPKIVEGMQRKFSVWWQEIWSRPPKTNPPKNKFRNLIINSWVKNKNLDISKTDFTQEVIQYVKKNIPTIAKRLQTDFKMSGYTVRLNTTTDKTYSKLEESCNQLIEHYNIINLIINVFTSRKTKEEFEKILFSSEQEILKTIPADIQKKLNNAVTQMFKKVGDFNISFSNFFTVTVKDKMNNLVNSSHSLIGNYSISGASHSITENYSKSLKHMSYWYFAKIAKKEAEKTTFNFTHTILPIGNEFYGRVASFPSLSFRIEQELRNKTDFFKDENFLYEYVRQFLTIYTQKRGTSQLGGFPVLVEHDLGYFGLYDKEIEDSKLYTDETDTPSRFYAFGPIYTAIPFSQRTYEEMIKWRNKKIEEAIYY